MAARVRIDRLLVDRELCESRTRAQALVIAGKVFVGDRKIDKPGTMVPEDAPVEVRGPDHPYVTRGGVKMAGALRAFGVERSSEPRLDVRAKVAMDVGASGGGFTDCLLQHGVAKVHAVDVGYGQLAWKLIQDPRVVVHDRTNIRKLDPATIGQSVDLVVVDCSFIGLAKVLPHLPPFLAREADLVVLVKPQFELEPGKVGKGGIVRSEAARSEAIDIVLRSAVASGFEVLDRCRSPIEGRDGNVEYLVWLHWEAPPPIEA